MQSVRAPPQRGRREGVSRLRGGPSPGNKASQGRHRDREGRGGHHQLNRAAARPRPTSSVAAAAAVVVAWMMVLCAATAAVGVVCRGRTRTGERPKATTTTAPSERTKLRRPSARERAGGRARERDPGSFERLPPSRCSLLSLLSPSLGGNVRPPLATSVRPSCRLAPCFSDLLCNDDRPRPTDRRPAGEGR